MLAVVVTGRVDITNSETVWLYRPEAAWRVGQYRVAAHPTLEDLAGNRLDGVFDRSADQGPKDGDAGEIIHIPFFVIGDNPAK